jgi:uncharacterized protein YndB with AHSA1/START domain
MTANRPYSTVDIDREIVISRVIEAPKERVYRAWTEPGRLFQWFGPNGFRCDVLEHGEARVGAAWRFGMLAPNGQAYPNRIVFLEVLPNERLVFDHGSDIDDDPHRFRVTVTFDEQDDGKTVLTLRQLHPSKEQRAKTIAFGAVEFGYQTLSKLADHLARV